MYFLIHILLLVVPIHSYELMFRTSEVKHDVLENRHIGLTCVHGFENINIIETSLSDSNIENLIVEDSILKDKHKDRFTLDSVTTYSYIIYRLNISSVQRNYTNRVYKCVSRRYLKVKTLVLNVLYISNKPICTTNFYDKTYKDDQLILSCSTHHATPMVHMYIPNYVDYISKSMIYSSETEYTMFIYDAVDNIDYFECIAWQFFPSELEFEGNKYVQSCKFTDNRPNKTTTAKPPSVIITETAMVKGSLSEDATAAIAVGIFIGLPVLITCLVVMRKKPRDF